MTIEQAIQKAANYGYYPILKNKLTQYFIGLPTARETLTYQNLQEELICKFVVLDPLFWQALGKAMGWDAIDALDADIITTPTWQAQWHRMIDHLADRGSIESFFKQL